MCLSPAFVNLLPTTLPLPAGSRQQYPAPSHTLTCGCTALLLKITYMHICMYRFSNNLIQITFFHITCNLTAHIPFLQVYLHQICLLARSIYVTTSSTSYWKKGHHSLPAPARWKHFTKL